MKALKPILNEAEGFYQIGPHSKCSEHFVLSVTVAFATNLPQVCQFAVIPHSIILKYRGYILKV